MLSTLIVSLCEMFNVNHWAESNRNKLKVTYVDEWVEELTFMSRLCVSRRKIAELSLGFTRDKIQLLVNQALCEHTNRRNSVLPL